MDTARRSKPSRKFGHSKAVAGCWSPGRFWIKTTDASSGSWTICNNVATMVEGRANVNTKRSHGSSILDLRGGISAMVW